MSEGLDKAEGEEGQEGMVFVLWAGMGGEVCEASETIIGLHRWEEKNLLWRQEAWTSRTETMDIPLRE